MHNRSSFHAGQYVKVRVSATSTEVGQIESLGDDKARILTSSGFSVSRGIAALEPAWVVVLDLNGVLGYRKTSKVFKKRPIVDEMLRFLFQNFAVGVWTSCAEHNGVRIIQDVFGELEARLIFKMYRDECTPNPTPDNRYGTFKDLRRVWDRYPYFDATNTIMVDDSEDKCSHRHNALCPTPYTGEESEGTAADDGLHEIMVVLAEVLRENTFEPVRRHMLARWSKEESLSRQPSAAITPVIACSAACADTPFPVGNNNTTTPVVDTAPPMPKSSPFAAKPPSSAGAGSPSGESIGSAGSGSGGRRAVVAHRSAARLHAEQDANDSDEDRLRPSVGNTPPIAGTGHSPAQSGGFGAAPRLTPPSVRREDAVAGSTAHGLLFGPAPIRAGNSRQRSGAGTQQPQQQQHQGQQQQQQQQQQGAAPAAGGAPAGGATSIQERMRAIALASAGKHAAGGGAKKK